MILVFGGTTEGKQVAAYLEERGWDYWYSTKTAIDFQGRGNYRSGAFSAIELVDFCKKQQITTIIDAAHPFAMTLHTMLAKLPLGIPKIRFERQFSSRVAHSLIRYVDSYEEALALFNEKQYTSVLALTGVQSIEILKPFWLHTPCWFRILNRTASLNGAVKVGFQKERLILGRFESFRSEVALYRKINPAVILIKESGINAGLDQKIQAAIATEIPMYILKKPSLPENLHRITDIATLDKVLEREY